MSTKAYTGIIQSHGFDASIQYHVDVSGNTPKNGDVLIWDQEAEVYRPVSLRKLILSLTDHNVKIETLSKSQLFKYSLITGA